MTPKLLFTIISLIGLFISLRQTGIFQKTITSALFLSIVLTWITDQKILLYSLSLMLLLASSFASLIYGLVVYGLTKTERIIISVTGFLFTMGTIFKIQHWPGQVEFRILLVLSLVAFIVLTIKDNAMIKERGFMLIWTALAIDQMIRLSHILR